MLIAYDNYNGTPTRLYRTPAEIKRDISKITERIKATNEKINVRHLLLEMLSDLREDDPQKSVKLLEELVAEAQDSLIEFNYLREALSDLECELRETRCVLR